MNWLLMKVQHIKTCEIQVNQCLERNFVLLNYHFRKVVKNQWFKIEKLEIKRLKKKKLKQPKVSERNNKEEESNKTEDKQTNFFKNQ